MLRDRLRQWTGDSAEAPIVRRDHFEGWSEATALVEFFACALVLGKNCSAQWRSILAGRETKEVARNTKRLEPSCSVLVPTRMTILLLIAFVLVLIPASVAAVTVRLLWVGG